MVIKMKKNDRIDIIKQYLDTYHWLFWASERIFMLFLVIIGTFVLAVQLQNVWLAVAYLITSSLYVARRYLFLDLYMQFHGED